MEEGILAEEKMEKDEGRKGRHAEKRAREKDKNTDKTEGN